ncbi:MAG: GGDEF domain-containing protein [Patescibacteria group bacterium]
MFKPENNPSPYDYLEDPAAAEDMRDEEASLLEQKLRAERRAETAEQESRTDPRTGLHNERAFDEQVDLLESLARHNPGMAVRIDFIDLRGLGDFNDLSPETGNQALREAADGLREVYRRKGDFISRWGGDEFVVLRVNGDPRENVLAKLHHEMQGRSVAGRELDVYVGTAHWKPEGPRSNPTLAEVVDEAGKKQSVAKLARKKQRKNAS